VRVQTFPQWDSGQKAVRTDRKNIPLEFRDYYGIAIAPQSDESIITVDGIGTLQAGRVLPMRAREYSLARVRPSDATLPIPTLQVLLFEHESEVREVPRPDRTFPNAAQIVDTQYGGFTVPFCGRRQAKIDIVTAPTAGDTLPAFDYDVIGLTWNYTLAKVTRWDLKSEANVAAQRVSSTLNGAALTAGGLYSYSFYIGGTDDEERWDALTLRIKNHSGETHTYVADISVIGELGAR